MYPTKSKMMTRAIYVAAVLTVFLGFWGWSAQNPDLAKIGLGDSLFRAISAVFLGGPYSSSITWDPHWQLNIARYTGLFTLIMVASKALLAIFSDRILRELSRYRHGHIVLAGDDELTTQIARIRAVGGDYVHRLCAQSDTFHTTDDEYGVYTIPGPWSRDKALEAGLGPQKGFFTRFNRDTPLPVRAKSLLVSMQSDADTVAISRSIQDITSGGNLTVWANIRSPWLARNIGSDNSMRGVGIFSEAQLAIRRVQRRHPPFLLAKKANHKRLHLVIVGFGTYGEAVLVETLLYSTTTYLDQPVITIVDPNAEQLEACLEIRYPEISECADIRFVGGALEGTGRPISEQSLLDLAVTEPITACFVCLRNESTSLAAGLALRAIACRENWVEGPIFIRMSSKDAIFLCNPGVRHLEPAQLISFGESGPVNEEIARLANEDDALARKLHAAYSAKASAERPNKKNPWETLTDDIKESNRRVLRHVPALLSSSGYDIDAWLQNSDSGTSSLPSDAGTALDDPAQREALACLEHDRWNVDRRINGWRYSATHDPASKRHDCLIPYSELPDDIREYDRLVLDYISSILKQN